MINQGKIKFDKNGWISLDQIPVEAMNVSCLSALTPEISLTLRHISWLECFDPSQTLTNLHKKILDKTISIPKTGEQFRDNMIFPDSLTISEIVTHEIENKEKNSYVDMLNLYYNTLLCFIKSHLMTG